MIQELLSKAEVSKVQEDKVQVSGIFLSVCLLVRGIATTVFDRFFRNLVEMLVIGTTRCATILVEIGIQVRFLEFFEIFLTLGDRAYL